MDTTKKYVLVTKEDPDTRVPKVLEDYIYSLNLFDDVIHIQEFSIPKFKSTDFIYVITQMWLNLDEKDQRVVDEMLSTDRVVYLNVEMLSESIRMEHILELIKKGIQIADYSIANILFLKEYAKEHNIPITKEVIYLPYQYNLRDQVQLQNIDDKYDYDIGIINALPKQDDSVNKVNTYRRTKMWNDLHKTQWKCINIMGWGKERDELIKRCKVIINIHHFEAFNIFEHIRCDRMIWAKKIIVSDNSLGMDKLDITKYIFCEEFDNIIPMAEKVLHNFTNYYRDSMKAISMDKVISDRRDILKQELTKIGSTAL
tara:strand:- start:3329 stop:4270 length:942 start_codon:yes stop_codon:yes gene_type:complete